MGYSDTKQEGPAANAVSALLTLLPKMHGINDAQGKSIISELVKAAPATAKAPTVAQWKKFLATNHAMVDATTNLTAFRAKSLHERLDAAAADTPSPRLWFALQRFEGETAARVATLRGYLAQIAQISNRDGDTVLAEFHERVASAGSARANGDSATARSAFHGHVPSDFATIKVLTDMRREAVQAADITAITHVTVGQGIVTSYGYDKDSQRLEVNLAGSVYAYRLPADVVAQISGLDHDGDEVASFIARTIFNDPAFQWEPGQTVRVCPACANVVAQMHVCHGPASAPYAAGVVVDLDPGAERIAADGTVLVVLRAPGVRGELADAGRAVVPVVVITAPDQTAETLGDRNVISGEIVLTADGVDTTGASCSCRAAHCAHPQIAGEQVRQMVLWGVVPDAADVTDRA